MMEKEAQENPAQPAGWAVQEAVNPDAHPGGELMGIEQNKRQDTAQWEDEQNRSPQDNENPAQPSGYAVPAPTGGPIPGQGADSNPPTGPVMHAKVFIAKTAGTIIGGKVLLAVDDGNTVLGDVALVGEDKFGVEWRDGSSSVEAKADYELVIRDEDGE